MKMCFFREQSDDKCPSADSLYNSEDQISLGSAFEEEDEIEKLKNDFKSKKEDTAKSKVEDKTEEVKPVSLCVRFLHSMYLWCEFV